MKSPHWVEVTKVPMLIQRKPFQFSDPIGNGSINDQTGDAVRLDLVLQRDVLIEIEYRELVLELETLYFTYMILPDCSMVLSRF